MDEWPAKTHGKKTSSSIGFILLTETPGLTKKCKIGNSFTSNWPIVYAESVINDYFLNIFYTIEIYYIFELILRYLF